MKNKKNIVWDIVFYILLFFSLLPALISLFVLKDMLNGDFYSDNILLLFSGLLSFALSFVGIFVKKTYLLCVMLVFILLSLSYSWFFISMLARIGSF